MQMKAIKRSGKLKNSKINNLLYSKGESFVDYLPWVEFQTDSQTVLLEDGLSVGAVFEITPIATEGRPTELLAKIRDIVTNAIQDSFTELDNNPWVVQFYCEDEDDMTGYIKQLRNYVSPFVKNTVFSQEWLKVMEKHLHDITRPEGLFFDDVVTKTPWRGQIRRTRMVLYRYISKRDKNLHDITPEEDLNNLCERITNALRGAGLKIVRHLANDIHRWLVNWLNPSPNIGKKAFQQHIDLHQPEENELPILNDFAENLMFHEPESKNGFWYFDNKPHTVLVVDRLRKPPSIGHITGENVKANGINTLFDFMPQGTKMCLTVVVHPQDLLEAHLLNLANKSLGENMDSVETKKACEEVKEYLHKGNKMYRSSLVFYLSAKDAKSLRKTHREVSNLLLNADFVPVSEKDEIAPLSSYLRWLPMCFDPSRDKNSLYTKFNFVQHIANLLPVMGRSIGTGNSGITNFNRGGGPLTFDPLNPEDRAQNAHCLILGPTGAGKSATLNGKIAQLMAIHRPRLFVIEAGNSFGLMMDYLERYGLTVHRISLKPGSGIVLPLFAEANKLLAENNLQKQIEDFDDDSEEEDGDSQRDILGEMEISARLMITGGEAKEDERVTRADRSMIRQAIINAAQSAQKEQRQTLTEDIKKALFTLSQSESLPPERRSRAYEMSEAMNMFCEGFEGELFNREGESFPDADIVHVDLATFAREGYEAHLAISYIAIINHINNLGEQFQHASRPIVNITDESHIITINPLLAAFLTKGSKMWRKLGVWLWLATQNMADFPDAAAKLLSMIEWWELLVTPASEAEHISRFKALTPEQQSMMMSATKANKKYTEGVVFAKRIEALFRVVPPSLYLALAMTEKDEKAQRKQIMQENNCSELEAAIQVAKQLDQLRGLN